MNKQYIRILAEVAIVLSAVTMTGCVNKRTEDVNSSQADIVITTDTETTTDETVTTDEIIADSSSNIESSSSLNESSLSESSETSEDSSSVAEILQVEQSAENYANKNANQSNFEVWDNEQYVGEPVQDRKIELVEENSKSVGDAPVGDYIPNESERVLLVNLTAREYGSDWVSTYDKAKVVATVMNRVEADEFPDTIYEVVSQPGQFDGYLPSDSYTYQVTDDCIAAVDYYFDHPDEFGDYKYFYGTGYENIFY